MIQLDQQTPPEVAIALAKRVRLRRKERKFTQAQMAERSGMSLSSYKRFEHTGNTSLDSLIKIAFALGYESDFEELFAKRGYSSIQEVRDEWK